MKCLALYCESELLSNGLGNTRPASFVVCIPTLIALPLHTVSCAGAPTRSLPRPRCSGKEIRQDQVRDVGAVLLPTQVTHQRTA